MMIMIIIIIIRYNVSTGQTSWDNPATSGLGQARVIGDWSENFDEHGNSYWINMVTGESSWELPAQSI